MPCRSVPRAPYALHVCRGCAVTVSALADSELAVIGAPNGNSFAPVLYTPDDCEGSFRGADLMRDTATRIVRRVVPLAEDRHCSIFLGEIVTFPGKWFCYPPHEHPQPEAYYYRFLPADGYGLAEDGDDAFKTHDGDVGLYLDSRRHAQAAAPGYAMYYLWMVHSTPELPYRGAVTPAQFAWLNDPDAKIFPDEC